MKRPRSGSTIKQVAYATRRMNGNASSKKEAALLSGFSLSVAENVKAKVEDTEGYQNAIIGLATESGNLMQAILAEFKARGLKDFNNADLTKALNAITGAWAKIEERRAPNRLKTPEGNPLRAVFMRRTETATFEEVPPAGTQPIPAGDVRVITTEEKLPREEDSAPDADMDF